MPSTVAYFKNGIGNWVLMTPALQALALMDDAAKVDVVIDSDWADSRTPAVINLIESSPFVNKLIRYPKQALNPKKYTKWFYSRHSEGSAAMQYFESQNPAIGHRVNWRKGLMHEMDYYMNIVRQCFKYMGPTPAQCVPVSTLPVSVAEALDSRDRWVGFCNGGFGKMRGPKCWPHFNRLGELLRLRYGVNIVGVGGPKELRGVKLDLNLAGSLSITETAAVLKRVTLFITTDTGLMHIADALEVSQLVLFGGSIVSKNGPVSQQAKIIRSDVECIPCQYVGDFEQCKDPRCMSELEPGRVIQELGGRL